MIVKIQIQYAYTLLNVYWIKYINFIILLSKDNNIIYHITYMIKYYPYKSDKPNKNITL